MRMYHPDLGREITVPDDDDCIAVHALAGWEPAPVPDAEPGFAPEPVQYAPVVKAKPKTTKKTNPADAAAEGDAD
jgi:hypothetical protein